mgnify:CR=1 FL=1
MQDLYIDIDKTEAIDIKLRLQREITSLKAEQGYLLTILNDVLEINETGGPGSRKHVRSLIDRALGHRLPL